METAQKYHVTAWWSSAKNGLAKADSAPNAIHFTAPPEFGGMEGRWTPEDLLLCAVATCYTTTFRALAEYSNLPYSDFAVEVEGAVQKVEAGYAFAHIVIRPNLTLLNDGECQRALRVLEKAKGACLVSRALSVEQTFEARVRVADSKVELAHSV